jgi:hypothetical protein
MATGKAVFDAYGKNNANHRRSVDKATDTVVAVRREL